MINDILADVPIEEVAEGIHSCLEPDRRASDYDSKVNAYDAVVGNRFYNRIVWGNWPADYARFCTAALAHSPQGVLLDAGCGSLVFTTDTYAAHADRRVVFLDRSLGMLVKGRDRIRRKLGSVPGNFLFLQGDILALPFRDHIFDSVAAYGVLHVFAEQSRLIGELQRVRREDGGLYLSSLVGNNRLGMAYLGMLQRAGEVATRHTSASLSAFLRGLPGDFRVETIGNMAYVQDA